jgi:hypothetical protein
MTWSAYIRVWHYVRITAAISHLFILTTLGWACAEAVVFMDVQVVFVWKSTFSLLDAYVSGFNVVFHVLDWKLASENGIFVEWLKSWLNDMWFTCSWWTDRSAGCLSSVLLSLGLHRFQLCIEMTRLGLWFSTHQVLSGNTLKMISLLMIFIQNLNEPQKSCMNYLKVSSTHQHID